MFLIPVTNLPWSWLTHHGAMSVPFHPFGPFAATCTPEGAGGAWQPVRRRIPSSGAFLPQTAWR